MNLPTERELARLGWPLTSKSSIYGRFLTRFNFMRANNGRPRQSIIFIRRSTWWMRVRTPLARIYIYMYSQRRKSLRVHSVACIYLLHFLSTAINFRSSFSLFDTSRKNEEEEPRRIRRQPHRNFAHRESFPKNVLLCSLIQEILSSFYASTIDLVRLNILFLCLLVLFYFINLVSFLLIELCVLEKSKFI